MLRRSVRQLVPKRSWQNLSALATGQKNAEAWSDIKTREAKVDSAISASNIAAPKTINWEQHEKSTSHPEIVAALKNYYNEQLEILAQLEKEDSSAKVSQLAKGWEIHQQAVSQLEKSVEESDKIVQSGVKALWISANNPDITRVKTNEWLDTDLYFQALVDRVSALSPSGYQFTKQQPESEKAVFDTLSIIDDRSDVKRRNVWMNQLHSYEYYDLHRRALLEHMTYYLLRTGGDVRFFPEIPPMDWLSHIEKVRIEFAEEAHKRRAAEQLEKLDMHAPLDLNPVEYSHGEDFYADMINAEFTSTELTVGKLMGYYGFLSAPYVPVRTAEQLTAAMAQDNGTGEFFSFGEDVNAVFYLPADKAILRPKQAAFNQVKHIGQYETDIVPGYKNLISQVAGVVELRGENWLNAPGEAVHDAFLRRLKINDPSRATYAEYVAELKTRLGKAQKISKADATARLATIAEAVAAEESAFKAMVC